MEARPAAAGDAQENQEAELRSSSLGNSSGMRAAGSGSPDLPEERNGQSTGDASTEPMENGGKSMSAAESSVNSEKDEKRKGMDATARLLFLASQGDVDGVNKILSKGVDVNSSDYDGRTALHLAAAEGKVEVVKALLEAKADVNPRDRWGNSPLYDATSYGSGELVRLLKSHGAIFLESGVVRSQSVANRKGPAEDFEIDPAELDLSKSKLIGQGSFGEIRKVSWRGTPVAVKMVKEELAKQPDIEKEFRNEVKIWQQLRHPNIVQFLGAVTKTKPLMIVTEYLSQGDLHSIVRRKGPLGAGEALRYCADIAKGMAYLHGHRPEPIVHRDLKPRNLLRDEAGHLKVADFGLSRVLRSAHFSFESSANHSSLTGEAGTYRYMAPEVFRHEEYDSSADVFSFAIIAYEMFEGGQPYKLQEPEEVASIYARGNRPNFVARHYPPGMQELIKLCWSQHPKERPTFREILLKIEQFMKELFNTDTKPKRETSEGKSGPACCSLL